MIGPVFASASSVSLAYAAVDVLQAVFDTVPLTNNLRVPVEVREIRITVDSRIQAGEDGAVDAIPFINLEGKFGKDYLTDGPVPISIMAPYRLAENGLWQAPIAGGEIAQGSTRRIILPTPIYVPPGRGFSFVASMRTDTVFFTVGAPPLFDATVTLALIGRYLDPAAKAPAVNDLPIISAVTLTQSKRVSLENDLTNPLSKPIRVHRLVGAIPFSDAASHTLNTTAVSRGTTIAFRYPNADPVSEATLDFVKGIFGGQMRVWPAKFDMHAASRIRAEISVNAAEVDPVVGYQVGLFGTRPEVVS